MITADGELSSVFDVAHCILCPLLD